MIKCLGYGGAERLLVDMVAAVDRSRFNFEVAFVLREQDALVPAIRAGGTPVHSLGAAHNADLRWMAALRRLLVTGRYDVVHFHLPYAAAFGQLVVASLPRSDRPGVVYTEHSLWDRAKLVNRALLRGSMGRGERLVAVSQASYDALPVSLRRRATTVVHGVDLSQSDSLVARRAELVPCSVRARRRRRRAPVPDRGQPPSREGLRRAARSGEGPSLTRTPHPVRRRGTRPVARRPPRASRRTGTRGPVPVPRPAR